MGASITFDDSLWPLLISRFEGVVSDAQYGLHEAAGRIRAHVGEQPPLGRVVWGPRGV